MSTEPSMEDILASIRKILSEETMDIPEESNDAPEEMQPAAVMEESLEEPVTQNSDEVFDLSSSQMISPVEASPPPPPAQPLVNQPVAKASACTLSYLAKLVAEDKMASIGNAGLTIEEIVKETVRPIIKEWLNSNLYDIVERLVRKEIEKVVDKVEV